MRRSRNILPILIVAFLLGLAGCGGGGNDAASTDTTTVTVNPYVEYAGCCTNDIIEAIDGHLVCIGEEVILSSGSAYTDSNVNYEAQLAKLLETTDAEDRIFGKQQSLYGHWIEVFRNQLVSIIETMNANPYVELTPVGTEIKTPAKCWVEDPEGGVLLGSRPQSIPTTTINGTTITAPSSTTAS